MHKFIKMVILTLLVVLSIQQIAFAGGDTMCTPNPTKGIESSNPKYGSSKDNQIILPEYSLFYDYYCYIYNGDTFLYCEGTTKANYLSDEFRLTLYLQKWVDFQWIDIQSWSFTKYDALSQVEGENCYTYQHGNYYRTRAVHYIRNGLESETQYSTSSYIYVE
jgi:hypothetical protein